jgi:hypothetical protein
LINLYEAIHSKRHRNRYFDNAPNDAPYIVLLGFTDRFRRLGQPAVVDGVDHRLLAAVLKPLSHSVPLLHRCHHEFDNAALGSLAGEPGNNYLHLTK